jgi:hypothetical protein
MHKVSFSFKGFEIVSLEPNQLHKTCAYACEHGFGAIALHNIDYGKYHLLDYTERWGVAPVDSEAAAHSISLRQKISRGIEIVRSYGLEFWLFHHEIKLPLGFLDHYGVDFLDFSGTGLWELLNWRLEEKLKLFPDLAGIVFTGTGERMPGFGITVDGAVSSGTLAERFGKMYSTITDICHRHDKRVIIRNHGAGDEGTSNLPHETPFMTAFLEAVAPLKDKVLLMGKVVEPDFQTTFPFNHSLARMAAQQPTLMEHSMPMEWNGVNRVPFPMVEEIKSRYRFSVKAGCVGVMARIDWDISTHQVDVTNSVLNTPNEVNVYAFSRLAHEPALLSGRIWTDFCDSKFGHGGAVMRDILQPLYAAGNKAHHVFGMRVCGPHNVSGGVWTPSEALACLLGNPLCLWTRSPLDDANFQRATAPDHSFIGSVLEEKDEALEIYRRSLSLLEENQTLFLDDVFQAMKIGLERAILEGQIHREYAAAFFHWLAFDQRWEDEHRVRAEEHLTALPSLAMRHQTNYAEQGDRVDENDWRSIKNQTLEAVSQLKDFVQASIEYRDTCNLTLEEKLNLQSGQVEGGLALPLGGDCITVDCVKGRLDAWESSAGYDYLPNAVALVRLEYGGLRHEGTHGFKHFHPRVYKTDSGHRVVMASPIAGGIVLSLETDEKQGEVRLSCEPQTEGSSLLIELLPESTSKIQIIGESKAIGKTVSVVIRAVSL